MIGSKFQLVTVTSDVKQQNMFKLQVELVRIVNILDMP